MSAGSVSPNQALWEKGDFTRIAATMRDSGEALVQRIGITRGHQVLDLGCGDGTTALPAAKAGAEVLGVDIARNLVEAGNRRAAELGLANCRFQQGDATNLQQISFARDTFTFRFAGSPSQFVDEFREYYGPTMGAFEAASKSGRETSLQADLEELFATQNTSADGTTIPATFLRVEVTC